MNRSLLRSAFRLRFLGPTASAGAFRGLAFASCLAVMGCDGTQPAPRVHPSAFAAATEPSGWTVPRVATALTTALGSRGRHEAAAAATDSAGVVHVVFAVDRDADGWADELQYARLAGDSWSAPERVAGSMAITESPQVAVDGDGAVHVLWTGHSGTGSPRTTPTEVWERVLHGGRWSQPALLYREPAMSGLGASDIAAGTDARGDVHVLYAPAGRGMGHLEIHGGHAGTAEYLDRDGTMMAIAAPSGALPLEVAYVGVVVSRERPHAEGDVYVRALGARAPTPAREAYYGPGRYSHRPRLVVDRQGVRHLFWLEDTDGTVRPEALYASTSPDGVRWSEARDITPASLRGGVVSRVSAVADGTGRVHLALRRCDADGRNLALYYLSVRDGIVSPVQPLAAPGELGPGDTQLVLDAAHHRVVALWRAIDGEYRWRTLPAG